MATLPVSSWRSRASRGERDQRASMPSRQMGAVRVALARMRTPASTKRGVSCQSREPQGFLVRTRLGRVMVTRCSPARSSFRGTLWR